MDLLVLFGISLPKDFNFPAYSVLQADAFTSYN